MVTNYIFCGNLISFEMKVERGLIFLGSETMEEGREWLETLQSRVSYCGAISSDAPLVWYPVTSKKF